MADKLLLNGIWSFAAGPDEEPPKEGWTPVRVPHRSREFEEQPPESGWYRTRLQIPEDWPVDGLWLDLGRVRHYGRAYLEDEIIGEHYHLRLPWKLDLSALVQPGGDYELKIYTHNCSGTYAHAEVEALSEQAEKAIDTLFWSTSAATVGLEGNVWLYRQSPVRLEDIYVVTSVRAKTIRVRATVRNEGEAAFAGSVEWQVERQGQLQLALPACAVEVEPGAVQDIDIVADWAEPMLWGRPPYGEPVLYFLRVSLAGQEQIVRFGFREVWAEGDQLLLNGEKLMPWGDHTISYVYERQWLTRKFQELADANISIVEHHRYEPPDVFYDVADEMGVFVVGANFCVGTGQVPHGMKDGPEFQLIMQSHLAVADHWMRRVRNHPSILFWDITDAREPAFCVPLLRKVKELDPSRIAEVTFDPAIADDELIELIDCYRLFSSREQIEASIETIRATLPLKPVRVGEAGIFAGAIWEDDKEPPLMDGWWDFLTQIPERNIHGLQTFHLADMDYRGFSEQVPNNLVVPVTPEISWPSQSGMDARIDPFGEGTQAAQGKARLYLNWCDPSQPVSQPTATSAWSKALFRRWTGRDVGPLNAERMPEVVVEVVEGGVAVAGAPVFVVACEGQGELGYGVRADAAGTSWFVLPEVGRYRFFCGSGVVEVEARCGVVVAKAGYGHVQRVLLEV